MKPSHAIAAWLVLSLAVLACSAAIQLEHNAIRWVWRGFTPVTIGAAIAYIAALAGIFAVAPRTTGRAATLTMWIVLSLLLLGGLDALRPETVESGPKPRTTPSPLLFRVLLAACLSVPIVLVYLARRGGARPKRELHD